MTILNRWLTVSSICLAATPIFAQQNPSVPANAAQTLGRAPLAFEKNAGQTNPKVKYLSRGDGYALFLTPNEAVFSLRQTSHKKPSRNPRAKSPKTETEAGAVLRMQLVGGNPKAQETAFAKLPGTTNYFIGKDKSKWRTGVESYSKVGFKGVYKGVDVVYHGNQKRLEYDFVVQPKADATAIRLKFAGAKRVKSLANGALSLDMGNGSLQWHSPVAYQEFGGKRVPVSAKYALQGGSEVCFNVGSYDHSRPLVIDPELVYSTYLGGSDWDLGSAIAVDKVGNAYICGYTYSTNFPTTQGAFQSIYQGYADSFVTKLSADGKSLIYSTYLEGCPARAIAVDSAGNAYITGSTYFSDIPVTIGAFQTTNNGNWDACVTKLSADGKTIVFCTYLGGQELDYTAGIAVDRKGRVYVAGHTESADFPVTNNAFQTDYNDGSHEDYDGNSYFGDAFVTCLSEDGKSLIYSTLLSGNDYDAASGVALDNAGNLYITGTTWSNDFPTTSGVFQPEIKGPSNAFVAKFDTTTQSFVYSTYLGGSGYRFSYYDPEQDPSWTDHGDTARALAVDSKGYAYVVGDTESQDFPVTPGAFQTKDLGGEQGYSWNGTAFVTKISPDGRSLIYSTYLGTYPSIAYHVTLDSKSHAFITGYGSSDFPTTLGAYQTTGEGTFVTKLSAAGNVLLNSTFFPDSISGIAVDSKGSAYVVGDTKSSDFPVTPGAFQTKHGGGKYDAFITKLSMTDITKKADVTVTPSPLKVELGSTVYLSAKLARKADNAVLVNKPLAFSMDGVLLGTAYMTKQWRGDGYVYVAGVTFDTSSLNGGDHSLKVDFYGDGNYNPSSATTTVTITKTATAFKLYNFVGRYGASVDIWARLYRSKYGGYPSSKSVTFKVDGATIGTGTTDSVGFAALAYMVPEALAVGMHQLTAEFAEDASYLASSKTSVLTIKQANSALTLPNVSGRIGATATFTATLTRTTDKAALSGKTVAFKVKGAQVGTAVTDTAGKATLAYKIEESLGVGVVALSAEFAGDSQYIATKTSGKTLTTLQSPTKLAVLNAKGKQGATVTLTATLTRTTDKAMLAGRKVRFQIDSVDVGSATTDGSGVVKLSYTIPTTLTVGAHTLTAIFEGDTLYTALTSSGYTLTVQ